MTHSPSPLESFSTTLESSVTRSANLSIDWKRDGQLALNARDNDSVTGVELTNLQIVGDEDKPLGPTCWSVCAPGERHIDFYNSATYADSIFDTVDRIDPQTGKKDGFITKEELQNYKQRSGANMTPDEGKLFDELLRNFDGWQSNSNDEYGIENDGLTRKDVWKAKDILGAGELAGRIESIVKQFDSLDALGVKDGKLSLDELNAARERAGRESLTPVSDREVFNALIQTAQSKWSDKTLTREEVLAVAQKVRDGWKPEPAFD